MAEPRSRGQQGSAGSSGAEPADPSRARKIQLDPARAAALDVLKAVRVDRAYANLVLPAVIRHYQLEGRDAAFATELASGTIRRRGTYDAILAACIDRPLSKVESKVLDALRVGTHQLLSMRVPDHAAISTTVDLVRARVNTGAGNFTNAVLRSVSERDFDGWIEKITPDERASPTRYAALAFSHPEWVVDELREAVGQDELHELLAADNENPRVTLVARPGRSTREELPGEPTPYSPYGVVSEGGDPRSVSAVAEGRAGVQDEGSQLVALATGRGAPRGPRRALAGPVRRPRRQGRAARGAGLRARSAAGRQRSAAGAGRAGTPHSHQPTGASSRGWSAWSLPTGPWRRTVPASSTGCSSTRPAPAWARCAAAPRRAGGASPTTCSRW